jgi:phage/plasmid-associated DNA primase
MSETKKFNEEVIKNLTGGDKFSLRQAGKPDPVDVRMNCVPVVVTNEVCHFVDPVFKERLFCVDLCNSFKRVTGFEESILAKIDHFFTHIVHYCKKYYDNGRTFEFSKEVKAFTQHIKDEQDPYLRWSSEQDYFEVTRDPSHKESKEEIYYNYTNFCKTHGFVPLGSTKFSGRFCLENGVQSAKETTGTRRQVYIGINRV